MHRLVLKEHSSVPTIFFTPFLSFEHKFLLDFDVFYFCYKSELNWKISILMKNNSYVSQCFLWFMVVFLQGSMLGFTQQASATKQPAFPASNTYVNATVTAKLIPAEGNTWGYDIYVEGKRFIHQASKPGFPGNRGFDTQAQAQKVADLVIQKIKQGQMPPNVSVEEMKKLKAL